MKYVAMWIVTVAVSLVDAGALNAAQIELALPPEPDVLLGGLTYSNNASTGVLTITGDATQFRLGGTDLGSSVQHQLLGPTPPGGFGDFTMSVTLDPSQQVIGGSFSIDAGIPDFGPFAGLPNAGFNWSGGFPPAGQPLGPLLTGTIQQLIPDSQAQAGATQDDLFFSYTVTGGAAAVDALSGTGDLGFGDPGDKVGLIEFHGFFNSATGNGGTDALAETFAVSNGNADVGISVVPSPTGMVALASLGIVSLFSRPRRRTR